MMHDVELSGNQQDDSTPELKTQQLDDGRKHPEDVSEAASPYSQTAKVAWEWACWTGEKTWDGLDFAGEVVANFLGLTRSKYQWMIDMQQREDDDRRQRKLEARQRRQMRLEMLLEQEKRKLHELEAGGDDGGDIGEGAVGGNNQRLSDGDDDLDLLGCS